MTETGWLSSTVHSVSEAQVALGLAEATFTVPPSPATAVSVQRIRVKLMTDETIFTTMTALAERTGALNLGQGFPDGGEPAQLLEAAAQAICMKTKDFHRAYEAFANKRKPEFQGD